LHGVIDYLFGSALINLPFGIRATGLGQSLNVEDALPVALGIVVILYSLLTEYEKGLLRWIPFPAHLAIDLAGGVLLVASPWLFGFSDVVRWPHIPVGQYRRGPVGWAHRAGMAGRVSGRSHQDSQQPPDGLIRNRCPLAPIGR
jgi:hypothetical protein